VGAGWVGEAAGRCAKPAETEKTAIRALAGSKENLVMVPCHIEASNKVEAHLAMARGAA